MRELFKYAMVLAFGLAVGSYLHGSPSLEGVDKLKWFDGINVIIDEAFAPRKPEAAFAPVDPAAAALIDEELDYRVAQRIGTLDGWRSFLAAHQNGAYAQSARAEVEKLLPPQTAPAPAVAEVSNGAPADAKAGSERVGLALPEPGTEAASDAKAGSEAIGSTSPNSRTGVAALTPDENCKRDGDRLEQLRISATSDEVARFASELGCEKLRPQLVGLTESLGHAAPAPAAAPPSSSVRVSSALGPKWRATAPPSGTRPTASSRSLLSQRRPNGCAFRSVCFSRAALPPILLALVGARRIPDARKAERFARPMGRQARLI
jgi:hypothetical protein